MASQHTELIQYSFPLILTNIELVTEETDYTLKINNQDINFDSDCTYNYVTYQDYPLTYVATLNGNQEYGPVKISYNQDNTQIILDGKNHEDLNYSFGLTISQFTIKNQLFDPTILGPDKNHKWLIYLQDTILTPTIKKFLFCRQSISSDKYVVLKSDAEFYYVAYDLDDNLLTDTGVRNPVRLASVMNFNIDESIHENISYEFQDLAIEDMKLMINDCDPLITLKDCKLKLCYKVLLYPNGNYDLQPQTFIHDNCPNKKDHLNSAGLANKIILNKGLYGFQITNLKEETYQTKVNVNPHQTIKINDIVLAHINFDIDINNKNSNPDSITNIKIEAYRSCCDICTSPRRWDCSSMEEYAFDNFSDFLNYFKYGNDGKGIKIGIWEIRISRTLILDEKSNPIRLGQTIYDRSHVICKDGQIITLNEIIIVDEKNYLRCDLSIPIKKSGNSTEDKNFVRTQPGNDLTLNDNFYYKVTANNDLGILPDPDPFNPYILEPNTLLELYYELGTDRPFCISNKLQLDYFYDKETADPTHGHYLYDPIFDYFTFSAIVETERSYFVQAVIEWYDPYTSEYPGAFKVDRGPIVNTANDNTVFAVTRLTESVTDEEPLINPDTSFCKFKIERVYDPINNLPIRYNEVYHISRLNFFQNNLRIFESPCYKKPDECWFNFNGIESFLWGISIQPSTDQLLSEVKVESWSSNNFDGDKIGKSRYEPIKVTIPCIVDLNKKDPNNLLSDVQYTEQLINNIFREYLVNRRDENGILKTDNTLLISYSPDRKYRGYISSVEEVELDAEKMQAKFKLEFTSPEGNYLKGNYELGRVISLPYDTLLKPFIYIKHYGSVGSDGICLPGPINYRIHDRLSMQDFTLSGWIGNANKQPGKTGFLQIDCFNKKIYFKAAKFKRKAVPKTENPTGWYLETIEKEEEVRDVTRQIPFYLNWLEISQGYWIDIYYQKELKNEAWVGIMGGEIINRIQ